MAEKENNDSRKVERRINIQRGRYGLENREKQIDREIYVDRYL